MKLYENFNHVPKEEWPWPNFSPREMACKGSGKLLIVPEFMDALQRLRNALNQPLIVSSGYRTPEHNARVSSTGPDGPHTTGSAVDILIAGLPAFQLLEAALARGFTGIGVKQHGPWTGRFLHLDMLENGPRPRVWSYN